MTTTDAYVIKLKVATFIAVLGAIASAAVHVTRTISKIEHVEHRLDALEDRITRANERAAATKIIQE